jgi:hypothetical protein
VYDADYAWLNLMKSPHRTSAVTNEVILKKKRQKTTTIKAGKGSLNEMQ